MKEKICCRCYGAVRKRDVVLMLTAAATSVTITLLPGDAATPVADQLAEFTGYFVLILCAILFEKYTLTIMGAIAFRILIPIAMLLLAVYLFKREAVLKRAAVRLIVTSCVIPLVVLFALVYISRRVLNTAMEKI